MHLHLHLRRVLEDYGPAHSFWLFSFERYNGLLGSFHRNTHDIEPQFIRRFLLSQFVFDVCEKGFGSETEEHPMPIQSCLSAFNLRHHDSVSGSNRAHFSNVDCKGPFPMLIGVGKEVGLEEDEEALLQRWYMTKFDLPESNVEVSPLIKFTNVLQLNWDTKIRVRSACCMLAARKEHRSSENRPCFVERLFSHTANVRLGNADEVVHITQQFAQVKWLKRHPQHGFFWWSNNGVA